MSEMTGLAAELAVGGVSGRLEALNGDAAVDEVVDVVR